MSSMLQTSFASPDTQKLENALQYSNFTPTDVLTELLWDGSRAEHAIATLSDESFARLGTWMERAFPTTAQEFLDGVSSSMLSNFSATVFEMVMVNDVDLRMVAPTRSLREGWNTVTLAQSALVEIARLSSTMVFIASDVSIKPFTDLHMDVPSTRAELPIAERAILSEQFRILKFFMGVLRDAEAVKYLEMQQHPRHAEVVSQDANLQAASGQAVTVESDVDTRGSEAEPEEDNPDAVYEISPPKAALYVGKVKGFGEWKVNLTENANSQLRKLRKKSPETLRLVMKKIKDLSLGHFSSDNHILISDTENAVPIFKANVSGDTRLMYQVDCVTDVDTGEEYQALRIFGAYNHAELGRMGVFWDTLGRDLGRQGKLYRNHCRARSQPRNTRGNDVFSPLTFSGSDQQLETSKPHTLVENFKGLDYSMILSMHRFVGFSKALFNSFIADRDIEFMFDPSSTEREIIEHPHSCYVIGRSGTGKTLTMMYKIVSIEHGWSSSAWGLMKPRQLFVTRSRMLVGEVQRTTDQLMESFRLAELGQEELKDIRKRQGEQDEHRQALPKKWSELDDCHFPLFVAFDKLLDLLEGDFADKIRLSFALAGRDNEDTGVEPEDGETGLVSGRRFVKAYWDHLPKNLTKGLDPASVFAEIMGVIQGSEETIDMPHGYLTRERYLGLSSRAQPTFASMRGRIYDIFEKYVMLKRRLREHDNAERTHRLFAAIREKKLPGHPVQFLYTDEAQDNLIVDLLLLRSLCNNPNGLFWAGDTAQTITLGSSFKFSELTSMMHRIETRGPRYPRIPPRTFHLAVNYRSHSGITDCSHTVVELISSLWPESIDKISGDRGWREGPIPVFIKGSADLSRLFGQKDNAGGPLELGSEQCIIVHDEASREALFNMGVLGGLILTVVQSKGLEFSDVFLWNFFANSEAGAREWDTVCELFNDPTRSRDSVDKYRNVCRELKLLYVAMTRARNNLFIIEESSHRNPVLELWKARGQIEVQDGSTYSFKLSDADSLPEDWARRGRALMDKQQYEQAKYCFDKAGLALESDISQAYIQQEAAITAEDFAGAGQRFESCAESSMVWAISKELFLASAVCYSRSGNHPQSARLYHDAAEYTKSVIQYCKASMMHRALHVTRGHREDIDGVVTKKVCVHFLDLGQHERIADLFPDPDECIRFMETHHLNAHLATYLESLRRYGEAAEVYLSLNNTTKAIQLFFQDENPTFIALGTTTLLDELWRRRTLGQPDNKSSKLSTKLVEQLSHRKTLSGIQYQYCERHDDEICMFSSIVDRRPEDLLQLGIQLASSTDAVDSALLSLDYAFTFLLDGALQPNILVESSTFFPAFCTYTSLLKAHRRDLRPSKALGVRRGAKLGSYTLVEGTFLYRSARTAKSPVVPGEGGVNIAASALSKLLGEALGNRLQSRVSLVNTACKNVEILRPCVSYCLTGNCFGFVNLSCRSTHRGGSHTLNVEGIHRRIRLLCQMIVAYGTLDAGARDGDAVWKERTSWMHLLSDCILVPFFALGTPVMFHSDLVPEFQDAVRVLNQWITDVLYVAFTSGSSHWISDPAGRTQLIPRATLLGYMLDSLRAAQQTPSQLQSVRMELWYGPLYDHHLQQLRTFVNKAWCSRLPGGLIYLRFLLDGSQQNGEGREAIIAHMAEGLSTAIILTKPVPTDRTLHNIILGRGWMLNLVDLWNSSDPRPSPSHDQKHIDDFVKLLHPMMQALCASGNGPAAHAHTLQAMDCIQVFSNISRAIKAFFFIGHWLDFPKKSRLSIVSFIANIPEHFRPPGLRNLFLYERGRNYQESDWNELKEAVWRFNGSGASSSTAERLVHIQKKGLRESRPMDTPGSVIRVVYSMLNTLPSLLSESVPQSSRQPDPFPSEWLLPKPHPVVVEWKDMVAAEPCFYEQLRPVEI